MSTKDRPGSEIPPELDGISGYLNSVGSRVANVLPSRPRYYFVFDPNPAFKSAFALPAGYIIVGGGFPGYTKEEELACDLNGQRLAAKAGYSPAGMLTLLETFEALRKGEPKAPSEKHPTLSERIAQAEPLVNTSAQRQTPLRIP